MGNIVLVDFAGLSGRAAGPLTEPAQVVVLPVVRIERAPEEPPRRPPPRPRLRSRKSLLPSVFAS